ncbi:hypothetical protein JCM24511_01458 [Saitozyma sp. JCM 24511]|nr:hypothetical protein JCM24511_01458 [Saitozyma sp. JCM 24511]
MSLIRSLRPLSSSVAFARAQASVRYASVTVTSTRSNESAPILANIEASWKNLPSEEQYEVYQQLEELQKKDWKELTVDEKKAAYFVAFGPHGPRTPTNPPGHSMRVLGGVGAAVLAAIGLLSFARSRCTWLLSAPCSSLPTRSNPISLTRTRSFYPIPSFSWDSALWLS